MPKKISGAKKKAKLEKKQRKKANPKVKIDLTYGLKNKKGKKNRQFVQNAQANMNHEENLKKKKRYEQKIAKQRLKAWQREQALLYKSVDDDPQFKNKKNLKNKTFQKEEEVKIQLDDETLLNNATPGELDDLIDKLRVKFDILSITDSELTLCNSETFPIWLMKWEKEKEEKRNLKLNKKLKKKKGGNKRGLTGRELFTYDKSLFIDDENAQNEYIYENDEGIEECNENNGSMKEKDRILKKKKEKKVSKSESTNNNSIANVNDIMNADLFLDMDIGEMQDID